MEVLKETVRNIALLVLLAAVLDLLLPSGKMSAYIKMVMGLFVLVSVLNPLLGIVFHRQEFEVMAWQGETAVAGNISYLEKSAKLAATNRSLLRQEYGRRMEMQMEALIRLISGVGEVRARVELGGEGVPDDVRRIKNVLVTVWCESGREKNSGARSVEPVKIGAGNAAGDPAGSPGKPGSGKQGAFPNEQEEEKTRIAKDIKNMLGRYFELPEEKIRVVFQG